MPELPGECPIILASHVFVISPKLRRDFESDLLKPFHAGRHARHGAKLHRTARPYTWPTLMRFAHRARAATRAALERRFGETFSQRSAARCLPHALLPEN